MGFFNSLKVWSMSQQPKYLVCFFINLLKQLRVASTLTSSVFTCSDENQLSNANVPVACDTRNLNVALYQSHKKSFKAFISKL